MEIILENTSNSSVVVKESESNNSSKLIDFQSIDNNFFVLQDRVEAHFFGLDDSFLFSNHNLTTYKVPQSSFTQGIKVTELTLDPITDAATLNFRNGDIKISYNFLRDVFSNSVNREEFFIDAISPDRTELRAFTTNIEDAKLVDSVRTLKEDLLSATLDKQLVLNLSNNNLHFIVNIDTITVGEEFALIVKLFNPLPESFFARDTFSIDEVVSDSINFTLSSTQQVVEEEEEFRIKGANFDIQNLYGNLTQTDYKNLNELINSTSNVGDIISRKGIELGIDYTNFENFIYFSSAEQRVLNFLYKTDNELKNYDHFEKYLSSNEILNTEEDINSYLEKAIEYDNLNNNNLVNAIPSFIAEDGRNEKYILFVEMIGHHFDNLWIYSKAVQDRYNSDNRVDVGIPKELLVEAIRNFGFSTFSSGNEQEDTYIKELYKRLYHNLAFLSKSKGTETGLKALLNCFGVSDIDIKVYENIPYSFNRPEQNYELTTSSLDRIEIDNEQDEIQYDLLSQYTKTNFLPVEYDATVPVVEVGFSSNNDVNKHIKDEASQLDIDSLIGDYTEFDKLSYSKLTSKALELLANYSSDDSISNLVRAVKLYDNALFRTIEQFIPERANLNAGIVVKPHLLNRSKAKGVTVKWNRYSEVQQEITGSNYEKNFQLQFEIPIGEVEAGDGGSFFASYDTSNFGIPKYNGELEGTVLEITSGELNSNNVFKYFLNTGSLKFEGSDFDTLYGNVNKSRLSLIREDTEGNEVEFQDSTYEDIGWANARFRGSKSKEKVFETLGNDTEVYQGETLSKNYPFYTLEGVGKGLVFKTTIKSKELKAIANGTLERPDNVIQIDVYFAILQRDLLVDGSEVDTIYVEDKDIDYNTSPIEEQKTHFTDFYQIQATDQKLNIEQIFSSLTDDDDYYPPFQEEDFTYYASKAKTFLFRKNNTTNKYEKIPNSFVFLLETNSTYETDKTGKILGLTQEIVAGQPGTGGTGDVTETSTRFNIVNGTYGSDSAACLNVFGSSQSAFIKGTIDLNEQADRESLIGKFVYTDSNLLNKFNGTIQYWFRLEAFGTETPVSVPIIVDSDGIIQSIGDLCSSYSNNNQIE